MDRVSWYFVFATNLVPRSYQYYGMVYSPHGLLFDRSMWDLYNPMENVAFDWMHTLVASGGIVQIEVLFFVLKLTKVTKLTLADIDAFAQTVEFPRHENKCQPDFFEKRIRTKDDHLRANAGETIRATQIVMFLVDIVLVPRGLMIAECDCLRLLYRMLCMYLNPNAEADYDKDSELLLRLTCDHHRHFLKVYGPGPVKPKHHLAFHCVDDRMLNCFAPERYHKLAKMTGKFSARSDNYIIKRAMLTLEGTLKRPTFCVPTYLHRPSRQHVTPLLRMQLLPFVSDLGPEVLKAKAITTPKGVFKVRDLVFLTNSSSVGVILGFMKCSSVGTDAPCYVAEVRVCRETQPHFWTEQEHALVLASALGASICYVRLTGGFRAWVPQHLQSNQPA